MGLTKVELKGLDDGTDGQIITYDASGNPVAVGPGTDGQVLTSTGAGSPPAFETPAAGVGGATGVDFNDDVKARWGTGNDLEIKHAGDHNYIWGTGANSGLTIGTDGTSALTVDTSQDININAGDIVFKTAGKGICLGVTSNTAANTLDDYEEGTWTIAATAESGTVTLNSNVNEGAYVKVGRLVHVSVRVNISAVSGQSGYLRLSLPFATSNTGPDQSWASIFPLYTSSVNLPNDAISTMGEPWQNTAYVNFMVQYDNGLWTAVNCNALTASSHEYISFTATYITDA